MTREGPDLPGERSLRPPAGVLAAVAASVTGTRISLIALPWFVLGSVLVAVALPRGTGRPAVAPAAPHDAREPGHWRRFGEGFALLRGDPLLLAVIIVVGITNLLDAALSTLMIPVRAGESGRGPAAIGLVSTVMGAAAAGGSLIAAMAAHRLPRRAVFLIGFLPAGAPRFLVLAVDTPPAVVLAVFAVSGFGAGFINPVLGAVFVERCRAGSWAGSTPWGTRRPGPASRSADCSPGRR